MIGCIITENSRHVNTLSGDRTCNYLPSSAKLPFGLEKSSANTITNTRMGCHSCTRETFVDGLLPHKPQVGSYHDFSKSSLARQSDGREGTVMCRWSSVWRGRTIQETEARRIEEEPPDQQQSCARHVNGDRPGVVDQPTARRGRSQQKERLTDPQSRSRSYQLRLGDRDSNPDKEIQSLLSCH